MHKIIFGDNQFFGVNHLSEEKARKQLKKFDSNESIIKILDYVYNLGIKSFMVTTYPQMTNICHYFEKNVQKYKGFKINPCLPHIHKYSNELSELGLVEMSNKYFKGNLISSIVKGGRAYIKKNFFEIMEIFIDVELSPFKGVDKDTVFLQNVITDLVLGLGMGNFFVEYEKYINKQYNLKAGFITMNMPLLYDTLHKKGLKNPIICTSFNKINFRMSGGFKLYEKYAYEKEMQLIAMQVLAAGALTPNEAFNYILNVKGIDSILFGSANKSHIKESKNMIEKIK